MKKFTLFIFALVVFSSCGDNSPPEEPPICNELLVGDWQSQSVITRITVKGNSVQMDSTEPGITLNFTNDFWLRSDFNGFKDTSKFNCQDDSLYLIKYALAFDTLVISKVDANNLEVLTESETSEISGTIILTERLISFFKK